MTIGPINSQTAYLSPEINFPGDEKRFREVLSERERATATIINSKEIGQYETKELLSAQQWFNTSTSQVSRQPRYGYRKVFDFVALNGGVPLAVNTTYAFAHNINTIITPTRLFGTATTSTQKFLPLPFVSVTLETDEIEIYADSTNVTIITGATIDGGANTLTQAYFIFDYLKN